MLIVLVAGLFLGCVAVLIVKKNRESLLLAATCFSLMLFLMGIMIVIAKRGGVSAEVERFLYFSRDLRIWLQYRLITLNQTGYLLALGRHLFPLCLLELAMVYSMAGPVRKHPWVRRLALALPVVTLILLSGAVPLSGGHCTLDPGCAVLLFLDMGHWLCGAGLDLAGP